MAVVYGDKKLRMGVFGTGWWSKFQIQAWLEIGNIEIVALYNRTVSKAENAKAKWDLDCNVYSDPGEVFENERLDVADIITETPFHAPLVKLAAKHRVPVICQKPVDFSYESCLAMIDDCRKADIPFIINENYRWQSPFRQVKKLIESGKIGKPFRSIIQLSTGGPAQLESQNFLKSLRHYVLFDLGVHGFDIARFLFGEPDRIYCQALRTVEYIAGDDVAAVVLTYKDSICTIHLSDLFTEKLLVEGLDGTIELTMDNRIKIITREKTEIRDCEKWKEYNFEDAEELKILGGSEIIDSIIQAQRNIIEELRYGKKAETTITEYMKTMKLTFSAIRSCLTGESIVLYRY
jgi:predicted dehydrogenase